jgi:hypothetical protein
MRRKRRSQSAKPDPDQATPNARSGRCLYTTGERITQPRLNDAGRIEAGDKEPLPRLKFLPREDYLPYHRSGPLGC